MPTLELEAPKHKCEALIIGGLEAEPPVGSRGIAPGQGVRSVRPPEAETLGIWTFNKSRKYAHFKKNWNAKKSDTICVVFFKKMTFIGRNTPQITVQ